jgi:hypothetical protein
MDYLLEDSGDITNDVWVIDYILNAVVTQTHNTQLPIS